MHTSVADRFVLANRKDSLMEGKQEDENDAVQNICIGDGQMLTN